MIQNQPNKIPQAVIANGLVTGVQVQNPNNLLDTTDSTALFAATSDVILGNFPFSLPQGAVIVGISGIMKARIDNSSIPAGSITPVLVDSSGGSNQYFPGAPVSGLSGVLQEYAFGGAYDVWGNVTWNATKINNLRLQLVGNSSLEVAWASLTVFYYIPQTQLVPPPFQLPGCADCDSEIQAQPFELAEAWVTSGPGATKPVFKTFNTPNGDPITLDMLGECGGTINVTVDPDLRKEDGGNFIENFNIDASIAAITTLPNGFIQVDLGDIHQRALGFSEPYGYDSGNLSEHSAGAVLIITNNGPWNSKLLKRCHIGTLVSAPIEVEDEGNTVAVAVDKFNFIGDDVQAEQDPSDQNKVNITVNGNPTNVEPTEETTNEGTNNTTPSLTLTVPLTVTSANYLRVKVITEDKTITGVTWDGTPMTLIAQKSNPGVNLKVAIFGLINPAVGAHNAVVTMPSTSIITAIVTGWLDVDTTSPVDGVSTGNLGTDNAPTDSATTTTDNTVMDDVVGTTNNPTTFSQFGLWSIQGAVTTGIRPGAASSRKVLAPQTVVDQYEISVVTGWAIIMAGIRGISNPGGSGVQSVTDDGNTVVVVDNSDPINPVIKFFATVLANLSSFITALTSNSQFQTLVNAFVTGGGGSSGGLIRAQAGGADIVIPGGTLGTDGAIEVEIGLGASGGTNINSLINVLYGGQSIGSVVLGGAGVNLGGGGFVKGYFFANGATNAQRAAFWGGWGSGGATNAQVWEGASGANLTVDSTVNQNLTFQITNSGSKVVTIDSVIVKKFSTGGSSASGTSLESPAITQASHGFVAGDLIKVSGANTFAKSQANNPVNSETVGMVSTVVDANTFKYISSAVQISGAFVPVGTPGSAVFLSPFTAGGMTTTKPTTVGQIVRGVGTIIDSGAKMYFDIAALAEEISPASSGEIDITQGAELDDFTTGFQSLFDGNTGSIDTRISKNFQMRQSVGYTTEVDHAGIIRFTNSGTGFDCYGFAQTDGGTNLDVVSGLLQPQNDFTIEILARLTYATTLSTARFDLPTTTADDPISLHVAINNSTFTPVLKVNNATQSITTPAKPASGDWFRIQFIYKAGILTVTFGGTTIFQGAVTFTSTDMYETFGISNAGITLDIDAVATNYKLNR